MHLQPEAIPAALAEAPDDADAHFNLGNVLRDRGDLDEGAGCYRAALARKPDHVPAHVNLARLLQHQGRGGSARASCSAPPARISLPAIPCCARCWKPRPSATPDSSRC